MVGAKNVHSKVSHSKPFYPNDSMSLECLDAGLELPIHKVQESMIQVWRALNWALGILFLLVNHAMGGSKEKMQECKCPKEFLKDAMKMKIKIL